MSIRDHYRAGNASRLRDVIAFIDDFRTEREATLDGVPIVDYPTFLHVYRAYPLFVSMGSGRARRSVVERAMRDDCTFCTLADPDDSWTCGEGTFVSHLATVGARTRIGRHVQALPLASIGSDCTIGDYATICPGAALAPGTVLETAAFVGANAVVAAQDGRALRVGRDATIAAGSVVRADVADGRAVYGDPASDLRTLARARRSRAPDV